MSYSTIESTAPSMVSLKHRLQTLRHAAEAPWHTVRRLQERAYVIIQGFAHAVQTNPGPFSFPFLPPRPGQGEGRGEVALEHHGITSGSLLIDDTDKKRSKSATPLAHLYKLRDKGSDGYIWGQRLVCLFLVTPTLSIPVGCTFSQPAPELCAWDKAAKARTKQHLPTPPRPPQLPPHPLYPTTLQQGLHLLEHFKGYHPHRRSVRAEAGQRLIQTLVSFASFFSHHTLRRTHRHSLVG